MISIILTCNYQVEHAKLLAREAIVSYLWRIPYHRLNLKSAGGLIMMDFTLVIFLSRYSLIINTQRLARNSKYEV